MLRLYRYILFALFFAAITLPDAFAQSFGEQAPKSNSSLSNPNTSNPWLANPRAPRKNTNFQSKEKDRKKDTEKKEGTDAEENIEPVDETKTKKEYVPQYLRPTLDGVRRGHVSMRVIVDEDTNPADVDDRFILVSYQNFKIRQTMSGMVMCDIRFVVLSTLDRKINNISIQLNWPDLSTPLTYTNVEPNVETYFDYTLVGDGCYSMDKIPNIVVNRCRVAGMSQTECAGKVNWLRKS